MFTTVSRFFSPLESLELHKRCLLSPILCSYGGSSLKHEVFLKMGDGVPLGAQIKLPQILKSLAISLRQNTSQDSSPHEYQVRLHTFEKLG